MTKNNTRVAIRNVRRLQKEFDKARKPDFRLRQDLAHATTYLEAVKAKDKAKWKTNATESIKAQLVQAGEEANRALQVTTKAGSAAEMGKEIANASRQESFADFDIDAYLRSLRDEHASKSILEAAESREEEARLAFRDREDAHIAAEKQLYEANGRVFALQRRLGQLAPDSK